MNITISIYSPKVLIVLKGLFRNSTILSTLSVFEGKMLELYNLVKEEIKHTKKLPKGSLPFLEILNNFFAVELGIVPVKSPIHFQ